MFIYSRYYHRYCCFCIITNKGISTIQVPRELFQVERINFYNMVEEKVFQEIIICWNQTDCFPIDLDVDPKSTILKAIEKPMNNMIYIPIANLFMLSSTSLSS